MSETLRTASCCCGELKVTVKGEPRRVLACHCDYCQRRTGNVSQTSAWFEEDQITEFSGDYSVYQGPDNQGIEYRFCPGCGSTVYWYFQMLEKNYNVKIYGIAVGCFNDPEFPAPELELHTGNRTDWVMAQRNADSFHELPPVERLLPKQAEEKPFRSEPRIETKGAATVQVVQADDESLVNHQFEAELYEVSASGLRISCDKLIEQAALDIWITLSESDQRIRLNAETRWCSRNESGDYEMGLEIIDNPISDINEWHELIASLPAAA